MSQVQAVGIALAAEHLSIAAVRSARRAGVSKRTHADCRLIRVSDARCDHVDDNNNNVVMMDRHVPPSIGCGSIVGKQAPAGANETDPKYFPRYWYGSLLATAVVQQLW